MRSDILAIRSSSRRSASLRVMLLALFLGFAGSLSAQLSNDIPEEEKGTGVDAREGQMISPDWTFHDEQNNYVRMGDYFDGKRPIVLSFNYSNCPKLCSVQLEKMALALRDVQLLVDQDFQVISVSIDPNEQASRAREMKSKFTNFYNKPEHDSGWHFLIGDDKQIRGLAAECGVKYKYIPEQKLYSHPPVFLLISPQGKIVRYIYGLEYEAKTIRQALIEAAQGKIGSPINRVEFLIGCYMFNDSTGQYTFQAMSLMRLGGLLTVIALGICLVPYWFFRRQPRVPVFQNTETQLSPLKP